ncbi:hypothetical protein AAGS39_08570 [Flavobacterium sp. CGRL2]
MSDYLPFLLAFVVALFVGIYLGKMLSGSKFQSEKAISEERLNALNSQLQMQKEQFESEKNYFQKQLQLLNFEKENIRTEKDSLAIQLSKKEVDFENLWERHKEQKK